VGLPAHCDALAQIVFRLTVFQFHSQVTTTLAWGCFTRLICHLLQRIHSSMKLEQLGC